ncbi:LLM class flavin-dependent oxidoreductase [Actinomadura sp. NEAU-AAG7]|uniref:LLM class flavin-dependent oxidoreductase n=1 Tax=Actinomadura sp. NEAU-AAG7 TaxID=2839640 RepID=UPI001BE4043D|nr:LLM class flavin-dependent oxidoreductase [Actinomadura sp. NEAU-AAG7]MBT2207956.1 LLM class flavin-dependent oxidoreductase [Actinomadura sp. NEAU-AAG7]
MTPLSVLDLAPVPAGGTARDAVRDVLDLARRAEAAGYHRYWLAEHHLSPGVASAAPQVLIGAVAAATSRIRVGSGAVQTGHWTPLAIVEQFGTLDALHPGRIDLGVGRSGQKRQEAAGRAAAPPRPAREATFVDGLLIPTPYDTSRAARSPRLLLQDSLLRQAGARAPRFPDAIDEVTALLDGTLQRDGVDAHANPGEGASLALWILGSSGGESARVAGERGLPFAANYHVAPASVLEAVDAYRAAFRPSAALEEPYVLVSADVVAAPTEAEARELASPYALWVHSIRAGDGAIPFPTPEQAAAHEWRPEDLDLVADRVETQFVGTPEAVVAGLETLRRVTGADELLLTTITHDHADRVRSFELIAEAWTRSSERTSANAPGAG